MLYGPCTDQRPLERLGNASEMDNANDIKIMDLRDAANVAPPYTAWRMEFHFYTRMLYLSTNYSLEQATAKQKLNVQSSKGTPALSIKAVGVTGISCGVQHRIEGVGSIKLTMP